MFAGLTAQANMNRPSETETRPANRWVEQGTDVVCASYTPVMEFRSQALAAREASRQLATLTRDEKDRALHAMADAVAAVEKKLLAANAVDVDAARRSGTPEAVIDRLRLDGDRVRGMVDGLRDVAALPDPVGDLVRGWRQAGHHPRPAVPGSRLAPSPRPGDSGGP